MDTAHQQLDEFGYVMLRSVFDPDETQAVGDQLGAALKGGQTPSILRSRGQVYGCRNLVDAYPQVLTLATHVRLTPFLIQVLGPASGLVRALFFDKPPSRSWSLPWHRDRTIAVERHLDTSPHFRNPTVKAGIPHVEAPESVLAEMLTLRLHLDRMQPDNGPLSVIPGSHRTADPSPAEPVELRAEAGDVLAMRSLLSHSSRQSAAGASLHRRVIHLEFAACEQLPDDYRWHAYHKLSG